MTVKSICIAHGGDISKPNGGTNRVVAFAKGLHDSGFTVYLVVPNPKRNIPKYLEGINVYTVSIKDSGVKSQIGRALLISLKAKKIAAKEKAILQIEHSTLAGFATLIGCLDFVLDMHDLCFEDPQYTSLHFSSIVKKFIYKIEKKAVNKASKIIVVSNPMKNFVVNEWNIPEEKIVVIPNGYFDDKLRNLTFKDVKEDNGTITFIGALHPKLDVDKFIGLAKSLEYIRIYIIGDGPVKRELEKKIRKYMLKNLFLLGSLPDEDAFKLLAKSQVTILPEHCSLHTKVSCPVKLFDYAALGKAIVVDDVAEMCKIFKENKAALVSNPKNQEEFIKNVQRLLEDERLRKKISSNAKRLVKDFTWKKQVQKLVKIYENL